MRISSGRALATLTGIGLTMTLLGGCLAGPSPDDETSGTSTTTGGDTGTDTAPACDATSVVGGAAFAPAGDVDRARIRLVAATGAIVLASTGVGLHRSTDGGETWSFVGAPEVRGKIVQALVALGDELFVTTDAAVFRSADGGETWKDVSSGDCQVPTYLSVHGAELFGLAGGRPFQWNPGKMQWDALPFGDQAFDVLESDGDALYANSIYSPGVYRLSLHDVQAEWAPVLDLPSWAYRAFAFTEGHGFVANTTGLFHSTDGGATWTPVDVGGEADFTDLLATDQGLFAATSAGLRISVDHGATWESAGNEPSLSGFALAASDEGFFAAGGDLRRAESPGGDWTRLRVLADSISWLASTPTSVLAMTSAGDFVRSADLGATWADVSSPAVGWQPTGPAIVSHKGKLFALDGNASLLVSADDGASFQSVLLPPVITEGWPNLLATTEEGLVLGAASGAGAGCQDAQDITTKLYLSTDEGQSWAPAMNGFPATFTDCYDVSYSPMITGVVQSGKALLATSWYTGLFRSVDGGASFQPVPVGDDIGVLSNLVNVGDTVVAIASAGGVARSKDGGATWVKGGLSTAAPSSLVVVKDTVFAGVGAAGATLDGVYASTDGGDTWSRVDAAFDSRVGALAAVNGHLFAGTLDESVWSVELTCAATD